MGIFLRLILFFFSIVVVVISALAMLVGFEFFSQENLFNLIDSVYNNFGYKILLVAVSLLFIIVGLYIFYRSMVTTKDSMKFSTNSTDSGLIRISTDTIENIALNSIRNIVEKISRNNRSSTSLETQIFP